MSDEPAARRLIDDALVRHHAGALEEAASGYRRALALAPASAPALRYLAHACNLGGRVEFGERAAARALALDPADGLACLLRGFAAIRRGRADLARPWLKRGAALAPGHFDTLNNLASAPSPEEGPFETARWAGRALALQPASPEARLNRANAWLALGRWREAWPDHELRLVLQTSYPHALPGERWRGAHAPAARLLVHDEIGYGDVFNLLRYLPLARARVGRLVLEVKPGLLRLLAGLPGVDAVIERGATPPSPEAFDLHVPIESLPGIFGTTVDRVPPEEPAPRPPEAIMARWRSRLGKTSARRIGLVWAGNPKSGLDASRSCRLVDLAPLADLPRTEWISLQKGPAEEQLRSGAFPSAVVPLGAELADFADTAAVVCQLDAVVSVETAVAHLAGALGRPTSILLSRWPAWRWLLDRADTPWYRSVTLYRQRRPGDWAEPVAALRARLEAA